MQAIRHFFCPNEANLYLFFLCGARYAPRADGNRSRRLLALPHNKAEPAGAPFRNGVSLHRDVLDKRRSALYNRLFRFLPCAVKYESRGGIPWSVASGS